MSETEDTNTVADELEATSLGIGDPSEEDWKHVHQHTEGLRDSVCFDRSETKSTSGLLGSTRRSTIAVTTDREWSVDEVTDELLHTVI